MCDVRPGDGMKERSGLYEKVTRRLSGSTSVAGGWHTGLVVGERWRLLPPRCAQKQCGGRWRVGDGTISENSSGMKGLGLGSSGL